MQIQRLGFRTCLNVYPLDSEQLVKSTRHYYLRSIMHDLTDENCQEVLIEIKTAIGPDLKFLVNKVVVPAQRASWRTVHLEILVLSELETTESTLEQ